MTWWQRVKVALGFAPAPFPDTLELRSFKVQEQLAPRHVIVAAKPVINAVAPLATTSDDNMILMGMILTQALENGDAVFPSTDSGWCGGLGSDVSSGSDQSTNSDCGVGDWSA